MDFDKSEQSVACGAIKDFAFLICLWNRHILPKKECGIKVEDQNWVRWSRCDKRHNMQRFI